MRKIFMTLMVSIGFMLGAIAQKTISGKITDVLGIPIPNVSIILRGTNTGTTTSSDGTYSITVPSNAKQLAFSSLGFTPQIINIGSSSDISLMLISSTKELDEVVITGINRVKRSQFTGATTKIDERQLKNKPFASFEQILQGRVPGVTALTGSGAPGSPSNIIIRGQGSIQGETDPLYIIDGIPVEKNVFQNLNANDFSSIDILRDAASSSLYGSRGSSGVIVITTKRGLAGKMKLTYSGQMGIKSRPEFSFRPMNTAEILKAQENYGKVVGATASSTTLPGYYYSPSNPRYATLTAAQQATEKGIYDSISRINTNFANEIFRSANFSNHQISLSGGTGKTRLYSSIALYNEEGITLRSDMKRVTVRNNLDYGDDKFNYAVSLNLGYTKRNFQQSTITNSTGNPFLAAAINVPYAKIRNADGSYAVGSPSIPSFTAANTLDLTLKDENYNDQFKGTLGITANYRIINELTASFTTGIDFRETQNTNYGSKNAFVRISSSSITGKAGFQTEGLTRFLTGNVRPSLTYRKLFGSSHDVEVTALGEYVKEISKFFNAQGFGTDPKRPNTPAAITQGNASNQLFAVVGGGKSQNTLLSGLALARYTYNGKYTLSGSYRQDGSSKLPSDTRWQPFYSFGAIWEAGKEDFISNISAINSLRVKFSYGSSGNANNFPGDNFGYLAQYSQGSYSGLNTIIATNPGNPKKKWETTFTTNLGVDFEVLNRRLYGDVNVYDKRTKDLFVQKGLSATSGFDFIDINAGELGNKGVEISLTGEILRQTDLVWTLFGNVAYNKNRVLSLAGETPYEVGTELITEGLPLGTHYEVKWGGVDASTGRPLYYDKSGNLTTVYSADNRVQQFGTWEAPWKGGFGSSLSVQGFDLSVLFSWQRGAAKTDNMEYFLENPVGFLSGGYNQSSDLVFWQKPGDIASTPSPLYGTSFSSKIIHDASFLRLRDLTLAYTFPKQLLGNSKFLSNARFYVQGSNLFIWTKWRGMDPEAGGSNLNLSEYPNPRSITMGLDVTF